MSLIGNQPISVPSSVQVTLTGDVCTVKGGQGELVIAIPNDISVEMQDQKILVTRKNDERKLKALHGLIRSLLNNAVIGVEKPWEKKLEVVGTGYKVKPQGQDIVLQVGYSHPVNFKKVDGVTFAVQGNNIVVSGPDKQLVGEVANKIKSIKKPDAYKGKGIRYAGEVIKLKPGKKAKTA